jgi:predicted lipoprotein with Yx(FWY)xxD motif
MRYRKSITYLAGVGLVLATLGLAACGGGGDSAQATPKTANGQPATVGVENTDLGQVLVDSRGHTLYEFLKDSGTTSACSGSCAQAWPPLRVKGKPTVGSGAQASLVGTMTRSDGSRQVTYNGHPLYLYSGDQNAGDTSGQGSTAFGAGWYALSSSGDQVTGQGSGGGGYGY